MTAGSKHLPFVNADTSAPRSQSPFLNDAAVYTHLSNRVSTTHGMNCGGYCGRAGRHLLPVLVLSLASGMQAAMQPRRSGIAYRIYTNVMDAVVAERLVLAGCCVCVIRRRLKFERSRVQEKFVMHWSSRSVDCAPTVKSAC